MNRRNARAMGQHVPMDIMKINRLVRKPISSNYIEDCIKGVNFVPYSDIKHMNHIDELLGPNNMCVMIYLLGSDVGHFVCMYKRNNKLYYSNSYGMEPDDDLRLVPKAVRHSLNENIPYLFKLIVESGLPCDYNEYKLQGKNTSTCGRHCIVRLRNKHLDAEQYAKALYNLSKNSGYTIDQIVTMATI
jgi:hypothetical protein